ncbi:MAG: 5-formyltetrahydrofolate cyclo-ligase [Bdellovibrionales bacterium]|nr:5-formyltetrahydrofolate cyclo-ligase [Bdellovibrionales bacterium]
MTGIHTTAAEKPELRRELKSRLNQFSSRAEAARAQAVLSEFISEFLSSRPGLWLGFRALSGEVQLPEVHGVTWAYPRVEANAMAFYRQQAKAPTWLKKSWGLEEPAADGTWSLLADMGSVRGAFIPGLGFDRERRRLGRGGGHYDRFLAQPSVVQNQMFLKVGIGFSVQLVDDLPRESHDVVLDAVVTESERIWDLLKAG